MSQIRVSNSNLGPFGCLIGLAILVGLGWLLVKFYYWLWFASPVLLLLALLIDWRIPAAWLRRLTLTFQQNFGVGLVSLIFAVAFFPFTALAMVINGLAKKRIERLQNEYFGDGQNPFFGQSQRQKPAPVNDEYVDYEEVESRPKNPDSTK